MSQQLWCWGRDIVRPEGNWLIERGFKRITPPEKNNACPSVYKLDLPEGRYILLRGFGVLFGDPQLGCVFLPRYEFLPTYRPQPDLDCMPWTRDDLPRMRIPSQSQRHACSQLVTGCIDWIAQYESHLVEQLGVEYRETCLNEWDSDDRQLIPAGEMASAWRVLSSRVSSDTSLLVKPIGFGITKSALAGKRSRRRRVRPTKRRAALPFSFASIDRSRTAAAR